MKIPPRKPQKIPPRTQSKSTLPVFKGGPGPGRPPNSKNRRTIALQALIAQAGEIGELPHMFMLRVMREPTVTIGHLKNKIVYTPTFEQRLTCARDAAPYFAPRLNSVEYIHGVSDAELNAIIADAAAEASIGVSFEGAGEEEANIVDFRPATERKIKPRSQGKP